MLSLILVASALSYNLSLYMTRSFTENNRKKPRNIGTIQIMTLSKISSASGSSNHKTKTNPLKIPETQSLPKLFLNQNSFG
jgi:hypothetical protein